MDSNSELEGIIAEKVKLEKARDVLRRELSESKQYNDTTILEIEEISDLLLKKDGILVETIERNQEEELQLQTEMICLKESTAHDLIEAENQLQRLRNHKRNMDEVQEESKAMRTHLYDMESQRGELAYNHAIGMHEMNKETATLRKRMEQTFKQDLVNMDAFYQRKAFYALDHRRKKYLLANAKLKDEVELQQVGISNLTVRLGREKTAYLKSKELLAQVEERANRLRIDSDRLRKMREHGKQDSAALEVLLFSYRLFSAIRSLAPLIKH